MYRYKVSKNGPRTLTVYRDGELRSLAAIGKHEWQAIVNEDGERYLTVTVRQCPAGVTVEEQVRPRKPL